MISLVRQQITPADLSLVALAHPWVELVGQATTGPGFWMVSDALEALGWEQEAQNDYEYACSRSSIMSLHSVLFWLHLAQESWEYASERWNHVAERLGQLAQGTALPAFVPLVQQAIVHAGRTQQSALRVREQVEALCQQSGVPLPEEGSASC